MEFSVPLLLEILPRLLPASLMTIAATACGYLLALAVGLFLLAMSRSELRAVRSTARWLTEFLRATPLLVQLYFLFFMLPGFGITLPPFLTGVLGLGLHYGAQAAEAYRAGLAAVPRGQWDAGVALNYPTHTLYARIILPQALPPVLPMLGNMLMGMLKDTPILSAITVTELMFVANEIGSDRFQYTEPVTAAAAIYLILSLGIAVLTSALNRRIRIPGKI